MFGVGAWYQTGGMCYLWSAKGVVQDWNHDALSIASSNWCLGSRLIKIVVTVNQDCGHG